ncbi:MAG TPA: hypothetical protein VNG51_10205 [Ktedonobacteraceae bacterium]|nr:hypothetical protein [Ktedonobacteraceae bacterium]
MNKPVLIASAHIDEPTYKPVGEILERSGYPVIVYQTDRVLSGEDQYTVDLTNKGELSIDYNGVSILPEWLSAAWYRKVGSFDLPYKEPEVAKQLYINNEVRHLHDMIWALYPADIWLSPPENLAHADRKLGQAMVAREVGFSIPQTIISSDWDTISAKLLQTDDSHMVIKMLRGVISDNNQLKAMYTHITDQQKVDHLKAYTYPFPAFYQPYIEKAREWRVTVVGEQVFSAAIYTDENARDDWRRLQTTEAVQFRKEKLPERIEERCIQYLGKMGLKFGAFDFIEKPDGEIVFLECNPNGQYGWLEEELGLPISEAIASELIKIAQQR